MASILKDNVLITPGAEQSWTTSGMGFNALVEAHPLSPGAALTVGPLTAELSSTGQLQFSCTVVNNGSIQTFYNLLGSWNM
jgi:hypothetical protein